MAILLTHAMTTYIPNVYIVFVVVFWEGLLGGLVYVNTFEEILDAYEGDEREFCLGAATMSDSARIYIAGFISLAMGPWLCEYQVARGGIVDGLTCGAVEIFQGSGSVSDGECDIVWFACDCTRRGCS